MLEQGQQRHRREVLGGGRGNGRAARSRRGLATAAGPRCRRPRSPSAPARPRPARASIRSGVTSAAVRPGVSSASRSASAIACASAAGSASSAARMPVSRRSARLQAAPFVAEVGGGHRMGDRAAAHRRRRGPARRRATLDLAARDADPVEQQLQVELRMGLLAASLLVRPSASHSSSGMVPARPRPGSTTMPSGIRRPRRAAPRPPARRW